MRSPSVIPNQAGGPDAMGRPAAPGTPGRLRAIYHQTIAEQGRSGGFIISLSFLLSTLAVRAITHAIRDQRFKFLFHNISGKRGLHIHHCVFGILGLLGIGYSSLRFHPQRLRVRRALDISYGLAAALTLDEFALWLRLSDVYWSPEGHESIDALILAGAGSLLTVEGLGFWPAMWRDVRWLLFQRGTPIPEIKGKPPQRPG